MSDLPQEQAAPKLYRKPIHLAQKWQRALAAGEFRSQAHLAHELGLSRARVSQMLRLFSLCPHVVEVITQLGDPLIPRIITDRQLRSLLNLPVEQQERKFQAIFAGIAIA